MKQQLTLRTAERINQRSLTAPLTDEWRGRRINLDCLGMDIDLHPKVRFRERLIRTFDGTVIEGGVKEIYDEVAAMWGITLTITFHPLRPLSLVFIKGHEEAHVC